MNTRDGGARNRMSRNAVTDVNIDSTVCATPVAARVMNDVSLPVSPVNASKSRTPSSGITPSLSPSRMSV